MTTLYVAGPMTGIEDLNYPAFNMVEELLVKRGFTVLNPARQAPGLTWEQYMRLGLNDVMHSDGIALLPEWSKSRGARLEVHVGAELGLVIQPYRMWVEVGE